MANPRVHEVAAELGIDSRVVLKALQELGEYVKASSSSISPPVARKVKERLWDGGYQPIRELFPNITDRDAARLGKCFLEFPYSAMEFMRLLGQVISPAMGASTLLQKVADVGELFFIRESDAGAFDQAVDQARPLEPRQLFARTGALIVENKRPERHRGFSVLVWNLISEAHMEFTLTNLAVSQTDRRGIAILEMTAPLYTERSAINGTFALGRRRDVRSLSALYEIVPVRDPLSPIAPRTGVSAPDSAHSESDFVRLYRSESGAQRREMGAGSGTGILPHHVRGHIRRQPYPSTGEVREIWIKSYRTGEGNEHDSERKPYLVVPRYETGGSAAS